MNEVTTDLNTAIAGFESSSANFAIRFIPDARVRSEYLLKAKALSQEILKDVKSGKTSSFQGARQASQMRNVLMDAMRGQSSEIARAYAVSLKTQGKSLPELELKYAKTLFGGSFEALSETQKGRVWKEIVFSSGRPRTEANQLAKTMGRAGKGFVAITIAISVYNIATAEDKLMASAKEGAVIGGGLLGSVAGGAAVGLACGPGSPVCVTIGVFIGGVMFAIGAEITFDSFWN
jgi:hypothetical protein